MPNNLAYTYTDKEAIMRLYGNSGVQSNIQDLNSFNLQEWWIEVVSDASDVINQYCWELYLPEDLATSRWVKTRATWIGAHILSQRRGNPALFGVRYQEILGELLMIKEGALKIPELPTRYDMSPAMSNLVVDDFFQVAKIRVQQTISSGGTSGRQDLAYLWPWYDI